VPENQSQGRNLANNENSDLRELKRRISPQLVKIPGVAGVGIHGRTLIVYLDEKSEAVQQKVAEILLQSEGPNIPVEYVVTVVFHAR
jgi:hypothetical protein